jgi:hypothetical protein
MNVIEFININHIRVKSCELEWIRNQNDELILTDIRNISFCKDLHKPMTLNFKKHLSKIIVIRTN